VSTRCRPGEDQGTLQADGIEVVGVTDHHIFKSIYFFDPNGIRLELSAQLATNCRCSREQDGAHAAGRMDAAQGRVARAARRGKAKEPLKPQRNDRPEVAERARAAGKPGG